VSKNYWSIFLGSASLYSFTKLIGLQIELKDNVILIAYAYTYVICNFIFCRLDAVLKL